MKKKLLVLFLSFIIWSCNNESLKNKTCQTSDTCVSNHNKESTVDIHFQVGFKNDSVTLSLRDSSIYSGIINTDWALGYADHVVIPKEMFRKEECIFVKVREKIAQLKYNDTVSFVFVSLVKDTIYVGYSVKTPYYD